MLKKTVSLLYLFAYISLLGCTPDKLVTAPAGAQQQKMLPPSSNLFLKAVAERGSEGEIYVVGTTNLPDGMKMWLSIGVASGPNDKNLIVHEGRFRSAPLYLEVRNGKSPFPAGFHKISFTAYFNGAWQNSSVLRLTGEGGKNLRGKLFKVTDNDVTDSDRTLEANSSIQFPSMSEEEQAISLVKAARLTIPGDGKSATDIENNIKLFMTPGTGVTTGSGWSAKAQSSRIYKVAFDYKNGEMGEDKALWSANTQTREVRYINSSAKIFSWTPTN